MNAPLTRRWLIATGAALAAPAIARAQSGLPHKPIRILVGFPSSGGSDSLVHVISGALQTQLSRSPLLPRSVIQMISAGEESGKLGEVLDEISVFYAKALKDAIKTVTSMIEPIMIVVMGSVVGFIAMAVILPIFKMSSLVSGR